MIVTTEAIVLKSLKFSESSKILTLYTEDFGKCSVIAKGARKAKNKFGSALEPLACSSVTMYKHSQKELHTLSDAEISVPLRKIGESFDKLTAGLAILESVSTTQIGEEQNLELYATLRSALLALNETESNEEMLVFLFQFRLAELLGFGMNLQYCPLSQERVLPASAEEFVISLADGAPYSPAFGIHRTGFHITPDALALLQRMNSLNFSTVTRISPSPRQRAQVHDFLSVFFQFHLEKRITYRTDSFLRDL